MIILLSRKRIINIGLLLATALLLLYYSQAGVEMTMSTQAPVHFQKIIVDPGHGGEDPGAVSDTLGLKEKDVNLKIANLVCQRLKNKNLNVMMTREEDRLVHSDSARSMLQKRKEDLQRRKQIMDEGQNIIVSIHLNKFPQAKYYGAQTFYPPNSVESQKLAESIQSSLRERVDPQNKREALLKKEPIIILKNAKNTTVIVECGFLSNAEEEKKLADETYQTKLADAIAQGVLKYMGR